MATINGYGSSSAETFQEGTVRVSINKLSTSRTIFVVAIAGLVSAWCELLVRPDPFDCSYRVIEVGTLVFEQSSPEYWAITWLALATVVGLSFGAIALTVRVARVSRRRIIRKA
jgi:hypothetical protein